MAFDGPAFIQHVAQRLIHEFEFAAGAGTPGLIGAAKEHPARLQLERLMPAGIGVGSGIVVDSYGGVSKQQDIIIYEKICPVFTHNDVAEASYFPVEGVIAVGEVKSTLGKQELADAFAKSNSVKKLRRHAVATNDGFGPAVSYRHYGVPTCFAAHKSEQFDQDKNPLHQVYMFVLCQKFGASAQTLLNNAVEFSQSGTAPLAPNFIVSLKDGFIVPHKSQSKSITRAAMDGDGLIFCDQANDAFAQLLSMIRLYVHSGITVDWKHYDRYFRPIGGEDPTFRVVARVPLQ